MGGARHARPQSNVPGAAKPNLHAKARTSGKKPAQESCTVADTKTQGQSLD